jgi:hypothetical protein
VRRASHSTALMPLDAAMITMSFYDYDGCFSGGRAQAP